MNNVKTIYLSLGSNQGNRLENLQKAINLIGIRIGKIENISATYKTDSWGFVGDYFLNICVSLTSSFKPELLIKEVLKIEKLVGRIRPLHGGFASRIIDIDILLIDNEIINTKDLVVPHPKMLDRKFVLEPLAEIAPNCIHPIAKKSITECINDCTDVTLVEKIDLKLNRPIPLYEKYNYIAIEGNIGAGKTSLANQIAQDFNAKMVLERFADNPFLPKFYDDNERYAFPLEMSFLADRYQQLSDDLAQFDLFKNFIVSDYYIFKSLIFAQVTLQTEEFFLYRKIFDVMYKEISKPDLYIYLYQNTDRLLENIKKRGRDYEQNISGKYLDKIHKGYASFIQSEQQLNTLIIDVSDMDFVNNKDDYHRILSML
ncbi:MAG: 2-amino-4-hydroxy-6-hydroxymethyldihydropteridine diphosphokinase [Flavobacteriaceae bacterium]|nr:2-amino-4-hydroxy-6-hydroxymethyldihydropteridine diphosphokinase [Flavobacteriaceae bacterium]